MREEGDHRINFAGYVIQVHGARHDVNCVMHTHTPYGMAVSALEGSGPAAAGHVPLPRARYHEFEGLAVDTDECERLVTDLGDKDAMIMRNHGLLTAGRTGGGSGRSCGSSSAHARCRCSRSRGAGAPPGTAARHRDRPPSSSARPTAAMEWEWLLRVLDRKDTSYRE